MQRAGIFSINVWDFLAFMRIIFNSDHWIRKQQQQSRWNDKLPVSAVLWRLFTLQPPQMEAEGVSKYRNIITLPRPDIVLTPRPRDRKVTTTGYCYNLQSSIVWTIFVLWWGFPHSQLSQWLQWSRVRWYGKTELAIKSFSASIPRLIALMAEIFWFPLMQDFSLIRHLLGLKAPNSWMMRWSGDLNVVSFGARVLNNSAICNTARPGTALLAIDCMLAVSRHLLVSAVCRDPGITPVLEPKSGCMNCAKVLSIDSFCYWAI